MDHGYDAILRGDTLEWTGVRPADWPQDEPVDIEVIVKARKPRLSEEARKKRLGDALDALARNQTPESIKGWMEHLEDLRKDKPLCGREED